MLIDPRDKYKIGILGLSQGAGSGFLASVLAGAVSEEGRYSPAVLELGKGGLYEVLGMERRFAGRPYFSFHQAVTGSFRIRGQVNEDRGVNWMLLPRGEELEKLDLYEKLRLVENAAGDVVFCRLSGVPREELGRLLRDMDSILALIDPLPSAVAEGHDMACYLRSLGLPIHYVINKFNAGVDRRELLRYLKIKRPFYLPLLPGEVIYGAEYRCCSPWDLVPGKELLKEPLKQLTHQLFAISSR